MSTQTDRGFLVLADISGFTAYVTTTELEHGPQIIAELLEAVIGRLSPPLQVQEVEGDAVFALGPDHVFVRAVTLLDVLESAFVAFKQRQRQMELNTTCQCNACRRLPSLNLKLIAHHGSFLRQTVGGRSQAAGPPVILAHRLLKNTIESLRAYLLLTEAAVQRTGIDLEAARLRPHRETYEHFGEVRCFVADLEPVWRQALEANVVRVTPEEALFRFDLFLLAPPPVAWDWLLSPEKRMQFQVDTRSLVQESPGGRFGPGTRFHCDHGKSRILETVLDWRPFNYCTRDAVKQPGNFALRYTVELAPEGEGTRLTFLAAPAPTLPWWKRALLRAVSRKISQALHADMANLQRLLEAGARSADTTSASRSAETYA